MFPVTAKTCFNIFKTLFWSYNQKSAHVIGSFPPTGYQPAVMLPEVMYFEQREVIMPGMRP